MTQSTKDHNSELETLFGIYSKVNKVIFSSQPIYSLSNEALAPTVFLRYYAEKGKMSKLKRAIIHEIFFLNLFKSQSCHLLIITNQFTKFQGSSSNSFFFKIVC